LVPFHTNNTRAGDTTTSFDAAGSCTSDTDIYPCAKPYLFPVSLINSYDNSDLTPKLKKLKSIKVKHPLDIPWLFVSDKPWTVPNHYPPPKNKKYKNQIHITQYRKTNRLTNRAGYKRE